MTSKQKFQKVMHEWKHGKLMSHGKKVTDQKQAIRIAFEEARKINSDYGKKYNGGIIHLHISEDNPLSKQLQKLTGDTWNAIDFESLDGKNLTTAKPFKHIKSGQVFIVEPKKLMDGEKIDKKYVIRVGEIYDHSGGKAKVLRTYEEDGMPMVDYEFSNDKITKPETQTLRAFIKTIQNQNLFFALPQKQCVWLVFDR